MLDEGGLEDNPGPGMSLTWTLKFTRCINAVEKKPVVRKDKQTTFCMKPMVLFPERTWRAGA